MCDNTNKTCENCIADILKVIYILQQSICSNDSCLESCDKGYLGQSCGTVCNTRPIMLYTCCGNGVAWSMPISKDPTITTTSNVFRIEKLDGCCATFRVLQQNSDTSSLYPYAATNSFFTMNLGCLCVLRCLDDTYVDCL